MYCCVQVICSIKIMVTVIERKNIRHVYMYVKKLHNSSFMLIIYCTEIWQRMCAINADHSIEKFVMSVIGIGA